MADHMNSPDSGSSDAVKSFLPNASDIRLYDTTLRDGLGMEGLSLSLQDKLLILKKLDDLGIHYIEGGYPGSNPKDADFFNRAKEISLSSAVLVAFGSTRKPGNEVEKRTQPSEEVADSDGVPIDINSNGFSKVFILYTESLRT